MKKVIITELSVYLGIFLFLAMGMHHKAWFSQPVEHIRALSQSDFGPWHPFFFTLGAYLLIGVIRLIVHAIRRVSKKEG